MQTVDLSLAVNYLPACGCLIRLIMLMLALAMVPAGDEILGGYLVIAAVLYMDRTLTHKIIFDGNAILMAVFFANTHAVIRATVSAIKPYQVIIGVGHLIWAAGCVILIAEPPLIRRALDRKVEGNKLIPVSAMLVTIVTSAYFQTDLESSPIRACRALAFTLLAFAWIYMIGINSNQGVGYLKETSWQFISRLAPALYSPLWLTLLFCPAIVWALLMHHKSISKQAQSSYPHYAPLLPVSADNHNDSAAKPPQDPQPPPEIVSETHKGTQPVEDSEALLVEELLKQAKQASAAANRSRNTESFNPHV